MSKDIVIPIYFPGGMGEHPRGVSVKMVTLSRVYGSPGLNAIIKAVGRVMVDHADAVEHVLVGSDVWKECMHDAITGEADGVRGMFRRSGFALSMATPVGNVRVHLDPEAGPESVRCILPERVAIGMAFGGKK